MIKDKAKFNKIVGDRKHKEKESFKGPGAENPTDLFVNIGIFKYIETEYKKYEKVLDDVDKGNKIKKRNYRWYKFTLCKI